MKILWFSPTSIGIELFIGSLDYIREPDWKIENIKYDAYGIDRTNAIMLQKTLEYSPDVILYISTHYSPYLPKKETFKALRNMASIVQICCDASDPPWYPLIEEYKINQCFDLIVNLDGNRNWPHDDKDVTWFAPVDPRPYSNVPVNYENFVSRPIHCGFSGGDGSPHRRETINHLLANFALKVKPREEIVGTYQKYADFMLQCKSVINMSKSGSEASRQVKGRVVETALSGACLLEDKGSVTSDWFIPGEDYIEYENKEHLLEIVNSLRDNDEKMFRCAENLHRKIVNNHSPKIIWSKIFSQLGL